MRSSLMSRLLGPVAAAIAEAATVAGLAHVRILELHGRVTEGDRVLRASA